VPKFSLRHRETVTRLAFLQVFLAWEAFLEESFILYLLGKKPPIGPQPKRLDYRPTTRKQAFRYIVGDRNYADWTKIGDLRDRSKKYFVLGKPFTDAFIGEQINFEEMAVIRNAIAHSSTAAQERFKTLVRSKLLGSCPPNLTIGGFLATSLPGVSPPQSFLEYYVNIMSRVAKKIVPM
jgi:hypothetical protein